MNPELEGTKAALKLVRIQLHQAQRDAARANKHYYSTLEELEDIRVRFAKVDSGAEPCGALLRKETATRENIISAMREVVYGVPFKLERKQSCDCVDQCEHKPCKNP